MDVVDAGISSTGTSAKTALGDQILAALKEKSAPELCLDSQDLEVGENNTTTFWLEKLSLLLEVPISIYLFWSGEV